MGNIIKTWQIASNPGISKSSDTDVERVGTRHAVSLGNEPLPIEKIIDIATQIASGLQAAHEKGIVHQDIY